MGRQSTIPPDQWSGIIKSVRESHPGRRRRSRLGRRLGIFLMVLAVVALIAASVFAYVHLKLQASATEIAGLSPPEEPTNVLVIGSDSRQDLPPELQEQYDPEGVDRGSGRRADTIILIHLDEQRDKAVLVHFPRDLLVELPDGKSGRINGSYQSGPEGIIDTVEAFTGLGVHHYIEVNFQGFNNIANALGGVNVYFERPIKDPDSGLNVPQGCVELNGQNALSFVRARKIDSDFGRIERQQLFVKLMMEKVTSAGTLLNPIKVVKLINIFASNVKRDAELTINDMRKIAWRLRGFDASKIDMRVVPSSSANIRGVSYVVHNEQQTQELFTAIRERRTLPDYGRTGVSAVEASDVRLAVLNGTDVSGLAKKTAEELKVKGFDVVAFGDVGTTDVEKTVVYFKAGNEDKAGFLAGNYGAEVKVMPESLALDSEVAIVLGRDFAEGTATPPPPPPPGKAPPPPLVHPC